MQDPSNRYILGPDPYEGFPVLLSESSAARYRDIIGIIGVSSTMREFVESMHAYDGSFSLDDFAEEPETLDEPFDLDLVPGHGDGYFPPDPRTMMLDDLDDTIWDVLDGSVTIYDQIGANPIAVIETEDVNQIRGLLTSAGFDVTSWEVLGCEGR